MILPPEGICVRCEWEKARDGDTVEVRLRTGQTCAIRLIDCWAEEKRTDAGRRAAHFLESLLEENDEQLWVWFPPLKDTDGDGVLDLKEILAQMTFDRVPGRLFIGSEDVSELMIRHGLATREKQWT